MAIVAIAHNRKSFEAAVVESLAPLPLEQMVSGKRVAFKPNDTWASSDDKTAVTQPETLRAVSSTCEAIFSTGAFRKCRGGSG